MEIKEQLTPYKRWIGNGSGGIKENKFIVIHWVAANSTAKNNADYYSRQDARDASANYFVDANDTYRVVTDSDSAWHCGANKYYNDCRNTNSIGIEMCCEFINGILDVSDTVVNRTIELTKELMVKYNIPVENVVRHYDVTRKNCPAPFVTNETRWNDFKSKLGQTNITIPVTPKEADQRLSVGSKIRLNGVFKINERIKKGNQWYVGCYATCYGYPCGKNDYIPVGPIATCNIDGSGVNYNGNIMNASYFTCDKVFNVDKLENKNGKWVATINMDGTLVCFDPTPLYEVQD